MVSFTSFYFCIFATPSLHRGPRWWRHHYTSFFYKTTTSHENDSSKSGTTVVTHTHTFLLVLVMVYGGVNLNAQGGNILFSNITPPDPTTGMQRCTVTWNGHAPVVNQMNLTFSLNGTLPICIDVAATQASIPAALLPYAHITTGSVSFIDISAVVNISSVTTPVIIFFRGEPASTMTLGLSIGVIRRDPDNTIYSVIYTSKQVTFASGFNIFGVAQKFEGTSCDGGSNNGIPGVTFTIDGMGSPSCFPGGTTLPASTTPPADYYSFDNLPANYDYSMTAAKSSGCDCGPNGPVTILDYRKARGYIVGVNEEENDLTLLEAHAGDYDGNGILNTIDLVLISKCHLGEPSSPSLW